jgi:hypothetical protein
MNEFTQFGPYLPKCWQQDGVLLPENPRERRPSRTRASKWTVAFAASVIATSCAIVTMSFSVPNAGAARRAPIVSVAEEAPSLDYGEVSQDHWGKLRVLMRTFERTPLMDEFRDPEIPD